MYKNRKNKIDLDKKISEYFNKEIPLALLIEDFELSYTQVGYIYSKTKEILNSKDYDESNVVTAKFKNTNRVYKSYNTDELIALLRKVKRISDSHNVKTDNEIVENRLKNIQNELITQNIDLIYECINIFFHNIAMPIDDAIMYGIYGLYNAITKYSYYSKVNFKLYAINRIIYKIKTHFYELTGISWKKLKKSRMILNNHENSFNDDSYEEQGNRYNLPMTFDDYEEIDELENQFLGTFDIENIEDIDYLDETKELVNKFLSDLPSRDRKILEMYFGLNNHDNMTIEKIADFYNLSKARISAIKIRAVLRIKEKILSREGLRNEEIRKLTSNNNQNDISNEIDYKYISICHLMQAGIAFASFPTFLAMANIPWDEAEIIKIISDINEIFELVKKYGYDIFSIRAELMAKKSYFSLEVIKYIMINYNCLKVRIDEYLNIESLDNQKKVLKNT